ncbi:MAG: hypothetical protein WCI78_12345, partial [Mycobacterium sp.]
VWRGRLAVALDALQTGPTNGDRPPDEPQYERRGPVETTRVQLPTGDRLLIPTGAEALRLKGYLILSRNSRRDYADLADMVDTVEPETAALTLSGMDRYYSCQSSEQDWMASQLLRRLADPHPSDLPDDRGPEADGEADWEGITRRCLSVAVAMLQEAR